MKTFLIVYAFSLFICLVGDASNLPIDDILKAVIPVISGLLGTWLNWFLKRQDRKMEQQFEIDKEWRANVNQINKKGVKNEGQ